MSCLTPEELAVYVAGTGSNDAVAPIVQHVESCEACRRSVAAAIRAARGKPSSPRIDPDEGITVGATIGRYVVRGVLGSGTMSHVLEAHDPDLGRTVALKVVRNRDAIGDARALREARALARLSHPNVVAVHDVGVWSGGVFLAMELVEGTSLRAWVTERRAPVEVAHAFRDVARGLAAAHAAGLVHRDIKPDNLVLGRDGRVRVVDFGLAVDENVETSLSGSPAYLAPEQRTGAPADTATDQYAFMVSLYEVLHGERYAEGARFATPAWLRSVLKRGLASEPTARFASMAVVEDALGRGLGTTRRRIVASLAAIGLVAAVGGGVVLARSDAKTETPCAVNVAAALLRDAWDPDVRLRVHRAFVATSRPYAATALRATSDTLDRYAAAWTTARTQACEATHVRKEQTPELLELRVECLERRRLALQALTGVLASADDEIVDKATQAAAALPAVAECADTSRLRAVAPAAHDTELDRRVAEARALRDAARYKQALEELNQLAPVLAKLGHTPATAEALLVRGSVEERLGDNDAALASFTASALAAESSRDDATKARALISRGRLRGTVGTAYDEADTILSLARATVARLGGDADIEARLENALYAVRFGQGRFLDARPHAERALAAATRAFGPDSVRAARERLNLASVLQRLGELEPAKREIRTTLAYLERELGTDHPDTVQAHGLLADVLIDQEDLDGALAEYRTELAGLQRVYGDKPHHTTIAALNGIGLVLEQQGDLPGALDAYQRTLAMSDQVYGKGSDHTNIERLNIGNIYLRMKRFADAITAYREVIASSEATLGRDNLYVANALNGIAEATSADGPTRARLALYDEALAIFRKHQGNDHRDLAMVLENRSRLRFELHDNAGSLADIEEALRIRELTLGADDPTTAMTRLELALTLSDLNRDTPRARRLGEQAHAALAAAKDPRADFAARFLRENF